MIDLSYRPRLADLRTLSPLRARPKIELSDFSSL
jgi:hypothetical protein